MRGRTALIIAHRLSTVRTLDRILVFNHGRIVEEGTHASLLHRPNGIYRRLFERQSEAAWIKRLGSRGLGPAIGRINPWRHGLAIGDVNHLPYGWVVNASSRTQE